MTNFNLLDWIALFILAGSILYSLLKGFVRELLGMLSLVVAFFLGVWFYRSAAAPLKEVVKTENIALFLGFAIVFLGTLLVGALVIWVVQKLIKLIDTVGEDVSAEMDDKAIREWVHKRARSCPCCGGSVLIAVDGDDHVMSMFDALFAAVDAGRGSVGLWSAEDAEMDLHERGAQTVPGAIRTRTP